MSRIVFVTTEIQPETPGGAGVAVNALSQGLASEHECVVLLLTEDPVTPLDRSGVEVINRTIPGSGFEERSVAAAEAIASVVRPGDRIEFQDFEGIAFEALANRSSWGLDRCLATVRFHGTYDMILDAMETRIPAMELPAAMEREVLSMADLVLVSSPGQRQTVISRYQLEPDRVVVAPLPIPPIATGVRNPVSPPVFAAVGRIDERKGPQDVVRAAVKLRDSGVEVRVRLIGINGWSPTNHSSMINWLKTMMGDHQDAFEFHDPVPRDQLHTLLADVTAVVVPSRFETFCYVAYEARHLGQPVIVNDLDVFQGVFDDNTGSLSYDGSDRDLARKMRLLATDPKRANELAARPTPTPGSPWEAYRTDGEVRHPRSQAGMATAAVKHLEAFKTAGPARPDRSLIQKLYARVPERAVSIAYKVIPKPMQRMLAKRLSWSEEVERRHAENEAEAYVPPARADAAEQMARLEARRANFNQIRDSLLPVKNPDVTVIIPVFNDVGYMEETLLSVFEQTHDSWEVVIVDDGSTDPEAKQYLRSLDLPRVRKLRQKNRGLPGARNAGLAVAKGRFVVPLDADDQLLPDFMAEMIEALESEPKAAYAHCYALLHHDVDAIWVTRPFNPYWQVLGNGVFGCTLIRRDALESVGGYDPTMTFGNEDWELWLRFMEQGWDQVQVFKPLVMYRKHGVSMSVRTEARFEEGRRAVRDRHISLYEALADSKRQWYPMITVIADQWSSSNVDLQVVSSISEAAASWGKYVIDIRGVETLDEDVLFDLAQVLEAEPSIAQVVTSGSPALVMLRRWNLHDPDADPQGMVTVDDTTSGVSPNPLSDLIPLPREGWAAPERSAAEWRPVHRHRPEEDGRLPDVWAW